MFNTKTSASTAVLFLPIFLLLTSLCFLGCVSAQTSTQWNIVYDLHGSGRCVINTADGGYAIGGDCGSQFLFLKVDSFGGVQWETTYGNGTAYSIIETVDGGYALAGTGDGFNFVKTDSQGNLEWSRNFNDSGVSFLVQDLIQCSDGCYVLAGWTPAGSSPRWDWTVKVDSDGNVLLGRTYGVTSAQSMATCVLELDDDGYVLAANSNISKLDSSGNMQWTRPCVVANALIRTDDGGYLVAAGNGATLVKLDSEGNTEWSQSYRFQGARWSFFHSALQSSDGSYVMAGVTYPSYNGLAWILNVDEEGAVSGEAAFPPETGINNRAYSIIETSDGEYVFTGSANAPNGEGNFWLVKLAPSVIPEFPSWAILPLLLTATVLAILFKKKLHATVNNI